MALATGTLSFDLADLLGVDFDARRTRVWLTTNVPGDTLVDTAANKVRLGSGKVTVNSDGTGSAVVWLPGADGNPTSWQTYVHADYADAGTRLREVRTFGPFTITATADLADLIAEQEVPPTYLSTVTALLDGYVDDAEAAATAAAASAGLAEDISNIATPDALVETLIENPASLTSAATSALVAAAAIQVREGPLTPYRFGAVFDNTTDDTVALQAWLDALLANSGNREGFLPGGYTKISAPLLVRGNGGGTPAQYNGVKITGAGRPSRNLSGPFTYIRQTTDQAIFSFVTGLSAAAFSDFGCGWDGNPTTSTTGRVAFRYDQPATGVLSPGPSWFNMEFEKITVLRAYRGWDLVTTPGQPGAVWDHRWRDIFLDDLKDSAFDLSSDVPTGQPMNIWDGIYINNQNGTVVSTGAAFNLVAVEGVMRGIDVEGWTNQVVKNSGGYSLSIEGAHIEWHEVDGVTTNAYGLFQTSGGSHLSLRNATIAGSSLGGAYGLTVIVQADAGSYGSLDDVITIMTPVSGSLEAVFGDGHFRVGNIVAKAGTTSVGIGTGYGAPNLSRRITRIGGVDNRVLKSESGLTADRPSAGSVGQGARFYDETLGLPIYSNGTVWKNALGTTV